MYNTIQKRMVDAVVVAACARTLSLVSAVVVVSCCCCSSSLPTGLLPPPPRCARLTKTTSFCGRRPTSNKHRDESAGRIVTAERHYDYDAAVVLFSLLRAPARFIGASSFTKTINYPFTMFDSNELLAFEQAGVPLLAADEQSSSGAPWVSPRDPDSA